MKKGARRSRDREAHLPPWARPPTLVGPSRLHRPTSSSYIYPYTLKTSKSTTKNNFHRRRLQDGISRIQKVAVVEIVFRGALGCFQGTWIYIGGRIRSVDARGAHMGGGTPTPLGRAGPPCLQLESTPSLLDCVCSKKIALEGFIPFGLCLIFLSFETLKIGKKDTNLGRASG